MNADFGSGENRLTHERHVVSADGTRIRYLVSGSGRPLVIVPGTLAPPDLYRPLIELLGRRHRVLLMERRGYGETAAGERPCRFGDQLADLDAVVGEADGPVVLFGHSFGGIISMALTAADPSRVERLVLYEPPVALLGSTLDPMLRHCRDLVAQGRPMDAVRTAFAVSGSPEFQDGALTEKILSRLVSSVPGLVADLECVTSMTVPEDEWTVTAVPVLLLRGERTTAEYVRSTTMTRTIQPTADFDILPGQAHFPTDMAQLARLVTNWAG